MTNEDKVKWIEALRSGKYQQGRCFLKKENKYCCLGVLKEITNCKINFEIPNLALDISYLSHEIQSILVKFNDYENKNFNEIANWIEKNL